MTQKVWEFQLDDGSRHTVRLEYSWFSGKRKIHLDEQLIIEDRKILDTGSSHSFPIGEHTCMVTIGISGFLSVKYDCAIDDRSVETGKKVYPPLPMPRWAWVFIVACGIIPFVTLGGVLPAALGFGGAAVCASIAGKFWQSTSSRVAKCVGVTTLCWIVTLFLLYSILR